jgi:ribosome-dependent ATPase
MSAIPADTVVRLSGVRHRYKKVCALDDVSLEIEAGRRVAVVGPDGVGKSTLLGLIAGVRRAQAAGVEVFGGDMRSRRHRARVCHRLAYMPQGLGQNLYGELSAAENVRFFGRLFNLPSSVLEDRIRMLLEATGLAPFAARPAAKLSGGMKQKLGLCCALIHQPDLLILDEPTTGIDPLSRVQFWELIDAMRARSPQMSVLVATAYMSEVEDFDEVLMMDDGRLLARGAPGGLMAQTGTDSLDAAYIGLLPEEKRRGHEEFHVTPFAAPEAGEAVQAEGLTRRFGAFTAVDDASFAIRRGEIFGFVGPNGCGKTTTMKMITGLLPPSAGKARLFGRAVKAGDRDLRRRIGYMSQSFSLYRELSVRQNLRLHARLFDIPAGEIGVRMDALVRRFGLADVMDATAESLPVGVRQRLSLAVAAIHRPDVLILDEPTSGVDPVARDVFWELIVELSRREGTTVFVSTHYLSEATRCDRLALMNAGRILACDSPAALIERRGVATLEEAFIDVIREDRARAAYEEISADRFGDAAAQGVDRRAVEAATHRSFDWRRLWALAGRETRQVLRDPFRMFSAFMVPVALMVIFGFGLTVDIENLPYAALDHDHSPQSRHYLQQFEASRYFERHAPAARDVELERRFKTGEIAVAVEIPPGFGRSLLQGRQPEVAIWIDGTLPYHAETAAGYAELLHQSYLRDYLRETTGEVPEATPVNTEIRYWFNQGLRSKFTFVPATLAVVLIMIPAMLTAVAVVREKEMGSITNLYATPISRLEFLWGKQLPYVLISFLNFLLLSALIVTVFDVPLKGSLAALVFGALLFVFATTGIGLLVSTFTRSQVAASIVALLLTMIPSFQYSGLLSPVSSLQGPSLAFGRLFPTTYYLNISVGTFTKDLGFAELGPNFLALALIFVVLTALSVALIRKQGA